MTSTKSHASLWDGQTLTAGAGDITASFDMQDGYGAAVAFKLTNGATPPTVPAEVLVQVSMDDSEWFDLAGPYAGNIDANGVESWSVEIPIAYKHGRLVAGKNTGQDVTIDADWSEVTALA